MNHPNYRVALFGTFREQLDRKLMDLFDKQNSIDDKGLDDFTLKPLVTLTTHQPVDSMDWLLINSINTRSLSDFNPYPVTEIERSLSQLVKYQSFNVGITQEQRGLTLTQSVQTLE